MELALLHEGLRVPGGFNHLRFVCQTVDIDVVRKHFFDHVERVSLLLGQFFIFGFHVIIVALPDNLREQNLIADIGGGCTFF